MTVMCFSELVIVPNEILFEIDKRFFIVRTFEIRRMRIPWKSWKKKETAINSEANTDRHGIFTISNSNFKNDPDESHRRMHAYQTGESNLLTVSEINKKSYGFLQCNFKNDSNESYRQMHAYQSKETNLPTISDINKRSYAYLQYNFKNDLE